LHFLPARLCLSWRAKTEFDRPFFSCAIVAKFTPALYCLFFLTAAVPARADNWRVSIYNTALPPRLVAVDKERQVFLFFEKKSPFKLMYTYPCSTGTQSGDKQKSNDLRTPEGVYFVKYKISSGLDFKEYGGIAYTLNYPNPVDRLHGKTGQGIWIHSKGFSIVPRDTRGCVAIGLEDINKVGHGLVTGTAVILAEKLDENVFPQDNGTARQLARLMELWSNSWTARSRNMFNFYDPEAYTMAMSESFAAFRQNKERLFNMVRFIKIYNREIHVLEGPGYWVTWAEQFYTASNLSAEGIRRLYWQKDKNNTFRIVGMEWIPGNMGMRAEFQKDTALVMKTTKNTPKDATTVHDKSDNALRPNPVEKDRVAEYLSASSVDVRAMLENWRHAWETGSVDEYIRYYDDKAVQQGRRGAKNIRRQKEILWAHTRPTLVRISGMKIVPDNKSARSSGIPAAKKEHCIVVDMNQAYTDSSGHIDNGVKTLQLCSGGDGWKIRRENWTGLSTNQRPKSDATLRNKITAK